MGNVTRTSIAAIAPQWIARSDYRATTVKEVAPVNATGVDAYKDEETGKTYYLAGTLFHTSLTSDGYPRMGLLMEDRLVSDTVTPCSLLIEGYVYPDKLPLLEDAAVIKAGDCPLIHCLDDNI